jgi:HD-like signal output (HDOD) protein
VQPRSSLANSLDLDEARRRLATALDDGSLELPVLAGVAAEVIASSLDDAADAARLAQLIQQDQSLAAHVLRVVNSPAFRVATEIVALRQAIARLGLGRIREIAIAASLSRGVFGETRFSAIASQAWSLASCAGLWSKEVARACRRNVEMSYLCGLFHNVGTPLVLASLSKLTSAALADGDVAGLLGELAPRAGAVLARSWKLPDPVIATVEHIKVFGDAGEHTDAVAIADGGVRIAKLMLKGALEDSAVTAIASIQHLNLYPDAVAKLVGAREAVKVMMESMTA